mgnify:CR=1 FL=1
MADVNSELRDFLLKRQHYIVRFENGTVNEIVAPYVAARREIVAKLAALEAKTAGFTLQYRIDRLNSQLQEIDSLLKHATQQSMDELGYQLGAFATAEKEYYEKLLDTLTVNVTEFMRDPPVYEAFTAVLRDLVAAKVKRGDKTLRIWSAGCSSGEEAYSLAILLRKTLGVMHRDLSTQIIASDIDPGSLNKAREGVYKKDALKNMVDKEIQIYFTREKDLYRVNDDLKRMIRFKKHDLIREKEIGYCDVIFCRNVIIYFSREQQKDLYMKFYRGLKDYGYLVTGKSETLVGKAANLFKTINHREKIYQKIPRAT